MTEAGRASAPQECSQGRSIVRVALITAAAFAVTWALTRHANHLWPLLPYAVLLLCPLMHLFHHGRHKHYG
mgnify:CR=1 FL=1